MVQKNLPIPCLLLFAAGSFFFSLAQVMPPDHEATEAERIQLRRLWFAQSRGLNSIPRPDQVRNQAARAVWSRMLQEVNVDSAFWMPVGPSPMRMLNWNMGRVAGRVSALAVDPTNTDIIFLGAASGGLWKTVDGGSSWASIFDSVGTQTIGSVHLDPQNPSTIWVGTGEQSNNCSDYFGQGLYRSTDGGTTFLSRNGSGNQSLELSYINALAVDPSNSNHILAGGDGYCQNGSLFFGGLFRSTDAGVTWQEVTWGTAQDVLFDPNDSDIVYAAIGGYGESVSGIYKSSDNGVSWSRLSNGIPIGNQLNRLRIAIAPGETSVLYALVNRPNGNTDLYRSQNKGEHWTRVNTNACEGQCSYNLCLAVHPTNADQILVGTIRVASSSNGGSTLSYLTNTWGSSQQVHQDIHALHYDSSNGNRFWVGSDGGLWRSDNSGSSFLNKNGNLNITQFYDIAIHPTDSGIIFGGSQDNSSERTTGNALWDVTVVTGDGFYNLIDPLNPDRVIQMSYPSGGYPSIYRSTTGGAPNSFAYTFPTGLTRYEPWPWKTPMDVSVSGAGTSTHILIGSNRVYRSDDFGLVWTALSDSALGTGSISAIAAVPNGQEMVVFAGTANGELFRTDNALTGSPEWLDLSAGLVAEAWVSDIAVDPNNLNRVFVTQSVFSGFSLSETSNRGANWQQTATGLPSVPANTVLVDPMAPDRVYVGTDVGMFRSTDGGSSFQTMMNGFPLGTPVSDLEVSSDGYTMVAGTYGRGAWRIPIGPALSLAAGVDRTTCTGIGIVLDASATNAALPLSWSWQVLEGPDQDVGQFNNTALANPTFTPNFGGNYVLQVRLTDGRGFDEARMLEVTVSTTDDFFLSQIAAWQTSIGDQGWKGPYDRNASDQLEILDLVLQVNNPVCD